MKIKKEKIDINDLSHFTPKQHEASRMVKKYKFVLYGGAMAGGKSYFLRWKLVRILLSFASRGLRNVTVGLFSEDYPSLKDRHLSKVKYEFPAWLGDYSSTDHNFVLKDHFGGGIIAFRNLDDASKYQSSEFAVIAVDELTKNTEEDFNLLRTRLRWPGIPDTKFIAATNPGGNGHEWVKKRWIDKVYPTNEKEKDEFAYVQALASDNPHIDPAYLKSLASLPEKRRKAFLEGNWDIFEGQYFTEWDKNQHVVIPFEIPASWTLFRSIDVSGRSGITSCHWYALDHKGNVYVYREYYTSGRDSDQHADEISRLSEGEEYPYTIIDSSAFAKMGLPETTAELYMRHNVWGLVPSSKERIMGWDVVHQFLRWDDDNLPKLRVFSTCKHMIRTIPTLIHDDKNSEDLDTKGEDHAADDLRYLLQTLREQKTPRPLTVVQKRMREINERYGYDVFNYELDEDEDELEKK